MAFILSPNMSLPVPGVGSEPGPQYATDVNNSLLLVDSHDHSPGKGVQVTPAGLNINSDLSMQSNSLIDIDQLVFSTEPPISTLQALYVTPGSETPAINDLWFNDGAGNAIQLTSGGTVNATVGSLPGESYSGGTFFWKQGTGSTTPANFDIGSITIRPNVALTSNGITLSPSISIASQYSLFLPLIPASSSFLTIDTSGNITGSVPVSGGITNSNLANLTIQGGKIADQTIPVTKLGSLTVPSFTNPSTYLNSTAIYTDVTSLTFNSAVNGVTRPGFFFVSGPFFNLVNLSGSSTMTVSFVIANTTTSTQLASFTFIIQANETYILPAGALSAMSGNIAFGSNTYALQAAVISGTGHVGCVAGSTLQMTQV